MQVLDVEREPAAAQAVPLAGADDRLRVGAVRDGVLAMAIAGRLDSSTTGRIWRQATEAVAAAKAPSVIVDAAGVDYCDGSGIAAKPARPSTIA